MASEPPEDAIANFVSFTSTTREQAISFLKANNLDSQKAINAYFEDPTPPDAKAPGYYNENNAPTSSNPLLSLTNPFPSAFGFGHQDNALRIPATAPPSRPPSRANTHETSQGGGLETSDGPGPAIPNTGAPGSGQGMSLAQREEQELQQAVAMSLDQGLGQQETGVTTAASEPRFGKATRDYYAEGDWAMTLFNSSSQEVVLSPDPEDRKRLDDEPAFIRPTQDNLYLGGFLTIVHEIPLAREALLLRNRLLFDYGHDEQWWNGQAINLPKIVTVRDGQDADSDWEDIIHETQRLMAFLDSTQRAFGSSDALAKLKEITSTSSDSEEIVARFLETWHGAAIRADPENPLATVFMSHAYKQTPFDEGDEPISKELFTFEPVVEQDHGQTLYDVLDAAIWSDRPGEDLDDVWLEHVGEVLVMKLDSPMESKSVDVKVPAVFYPDRYLSSCRDLSRDFRTKRLELLKDLQELERRMRLITHPPSCRGKMSTPEVLEKAAAAVPVVLSKNRVNKTEDTDQEADDRWAESIVGRLRAFAAKIEAKLKDLEQRKQCVMETMRTYSKALTEPSENPSEPPLHKYTLRGVCTEPHVTYILKRNDSSNNAGDAMEVDDENKSDYQWWRISFSTEDGKTRQAEKREAQGDQAATQNGDVVGYTARKVREIEVLRAAREESRTVLLVYASDRAMGVKVDAAPPQLQGFVNKDNEAFMAELDQNTNKNNPNDPSGQSKNNAAPQQPTRKGQQVNVFDYEVAEFDNESSAGQEMQEKTGSSLLGTSSAHAANPAVSSALDDDSEWTAGDGDEQMTDHVEGAKAPEA